MLLKQAVVETEHVIFLLNYDKFHLQVVFLISSTSLCCSVASPTAPTEAEEADFFLLSGSFHFKWNLSKQIH